MPDRKIYYGGEYMVLHENGCISRPAIGMGASGQWKVTGAVEINNFGHETRRYSLAEILANPGAIPWKHKNGKQRVHVCDLDHGTRRTWMSPEHRIF
jgi:hypothetical protein